MSKRNVMISVGHKTDKGRRSPVNSGSFSGAGPGRQTAKEQNQKRSCIKVESGEAFEMMTNLRYSALSIRAAEFLRPTVTAIPASRSQAKPLPLTLGFGSVMQQTTLFTPATIRASQHGGVRLPFPRWQQGSRLT